jgi:hypothetical protein
MSTGTDAVAAEIETQIGPPYPIEFSDGWTLSTSWERAQTQAATVGSVDPARFRVLLPDGSDAHRVTFTIHDGDLVHQCDCKGWQYARPSEPCAHVLHLWWRWCLGRAAVVDLATGRTHLTPPWWLAVAGPSSRADAPARE